MWKFRISLGVVLFGLAGLLALGAWQSGDGDVIGRLAQWAGAVAFAWQGFRAFLGKADPAQTQPTAPPWQPETRTPPPATRASNWEEVMMAAGKSLAGTMLFMHRVVVVLGLLLLAPITLFLFIWSIIEFLKGSLLRGVEMLLVSGWIGWYCWGPLRRYWHGDDLQDSKDETNADVVAERAHEDIAGAASDNSSVFASTQPPQVSSLPEEFLLLSHLDSGEVPNLGRISAGCAAAELGELALQGRLRVVPRKKSKLFGFFLYSGPGTIRLLDAAPTGLAWADDLLTELEVRTAAKGGPISLYKWIGSRRSEAFSLHRAALTDRGVLRHSEQADRDYPDAALRNTLIRQLQAANSELAPMDEHMLLLRETVCGAGLYLHLELTTSIRQRLDQARGIGATAVIPEAIRDTGTMLDMILVYFMNS